MQAVIDATKAYAGRTEIVIDYDHQSVFGAKDGVGGTAKAAGWIKELQARADGIWGRVEWTAAAEAAIKAGEYRYLSPVLMNDKTGKVRAIRNAALTNSPALEQLAQVAASTVDFAEHESVPLSIPPEKAPMSQNVPLASLAQLLGLDVAADAEAFSVKLGEAVGLAKSAGVLDQALKVAGIQASEKPDPAGFVPLAVFQDTLGQLNKLRQGVTKGEAERVVNGHINDGHLMPFMRDWAVELCTTNLPALEAFVAKVGPATSKVLEPQLGNRKPGEQSPNAPLTAAELAICTNMGLTPEEFVKSRRHPLG